jgi:CubicO group peptidase (beta-lactamase class C family)
MSNFGLADDADDSRRRPGKRLNSSQNVQWARLVSNQRPLACEASALPLSYGPSAADSRALALRPDPALQAQSSSTTPRDRPQAHTPMLDSGAFGWDGGFGTSWLVDPAHDLTVIVLTQRMFEISELPQVHRDIQTAAYSALT